MKRSKITISAATFYSGFLNIPDMSSWISLAAVSIWANLVEAMLTSHLYLDLHDLRTNKPLKHPISNRNFFYYFHYSSQLSHSSMRYFHEYLYNNEKIAPKETRKNW